MKGKRGKNFPLGTYGDDQTHPTGAPGSINLPRWPRTALCDKTFFPGTLLTGKEAQGEDTAGILSFQLLRTLAYIHSTDLIGLLLCVREKETDPVLYGGD